MNVARSQAPRRIVRRVGTRGGWRRCCSSALLEHVFGYARAGGIADPAPLDEPGMRRERFVPRVTQHLLAIEYAAEDPGGKEPGRVAFLRQIVDPGERRQDRDIGRDDRAG